MVTPGRSRPALLTQRQVDELARGEPGGAAPVLHAPRHAPAAEEALAQARAPVPLTAREMQAIGRGGRASPQIRRRIASETAAETTPAGGNAKRGRGPSESAPSLRPPGAGKPR